MLIMSKKNWKEKVNSACNNNVHTSASQHKEQVWRKEDEMESVSGADVMDVNVWGCNANTAVWLEMQRWTNENLALWLKASCQPSVRILWGNGDLFLLAVQCVMTKSMFWCQSHACKWRVSFQNHTSVFISDVNFQLSYVINSLQPNPWSQYSDLKWNPSVFHIPIILKIPIKQCCSLDVTSWCSTAAQSRRGWVWDDDAQHSR